MGHKKLLQQMIAVTLIMLFSVRCSTRATTPIPEVLAPTSTPEPPAMTPTPEPTVCMMRYSDPYLGFVVEYPLGWEVTGYWELPNPTGQPLTGVDFRSNLYMNGEQVFGNYSVNVAVGEAMKSTLTDTVEYRLSPIVAGVGDQIKRHCCLTVGGEPAMELAGYPWGRWGNRRIVVIHNGREYWLTFYPYDMQSNTPSDIAAWAAFNAFLRSFTFIPITVLPTRTIAPVPTPTS
jgi:hypothetical protein